MALVQVATETITSGVSSISILGITTDDVYLLAYHSLFMTDDGRVPNIKFTKSSDNSADSSSNYQQAWKSMYSRTSSYNGANANAPHFSNNATGTTQQEGQAGTIYFNNFNDSSEYSFMSLEAVNITETPEYTSMFKGGVLKVAQSTNGIQFVANAGTIKSGTFTMYRVI